MNRRIIHIRRFFFARSTIGSPIDIIVSSMINIIIPTLSRKVIVYSPNQALAQMSLGRNELAFPVHAVEAHNLWQAVG